MFFSLHAAQKSTFTSDNPLYVSCTGIECHGLHAGQPDIDTSTKRGSRIRTQSPVTHHAWLLSWGCACLQAVGLRGGYHTAMVMGGLHYKVHGVRLAQASEMQLDLKVDGASRSKGTTLKTHMQLDGEPWQQELPSEEGAPPMQVSGRPLSSWQPTVLLLTGPPFACTSLVCCSCDCCGSGLPPE